MDQYDYYHPDEMSMSPRRIILITGMPRSGTTPVGDVLNSAKHTSSLYEPMNFLSGDKCIGRYFEMPGSAEFSNEIFDDLVARIRVLNLRLKSGTWPEDGRLRRLVKMATGGRSRISLLKARLKPNLGTIIWKDPIAAFAAERAVLVHGITTIVTYRPPHAIAASFKRLGWRFDLDDILSRTASAPWRRQNMPRYDTSDPVSNASILWSLVYSSLSYLSRRSPLVSVLDMDRIIAAPLETYGTIFHDLGMTLTPRIQRHLRTMYRENTAKSEITVPMGRAHVRMRDLKGVNAYWSHILTPSEERTVTAITEETASELSVLL